MAADYTSALEGHLLRASEASLHQAYELGRQSLNDGLSLVDVALLHHDALAHLMSDIDDDANALERAAQFFAECLSPFEMSLRGYSEVNARLVESNLALAQANVETQAAHVALIAETAERERMVVELQQAQKLKAIGEIAGGVAHNFNNLLTVIIGNLDLARRRLKGVEHVEGFITAAYEGAERGAKVTRQLLAFSRQEMLSPQVLAPSPRLVDIASMISASLRGDIAVRCSPPDGLWTVNIDPSQLELALLNLAFNARDAMPDGGVLRLNAANRTLRDGRLGLNGEYLVIEVSDDGEGISPENLDRVFDPFFTTKGAASGTGLGLSQVYGFAHQSRGAVDIVSVLGEGTTVRLYLPADRRTAANDTEAAQPTRRHDVEGGTVLVVEDDDAVADLAVGLLEGCGYLVKRADSARSALRLLRNGEHVDLLFSDIMMPGGMNGIQLAQEVRRGFPDISILLTTGYSDAIVDADARGMKILAKPYGDVELRRDVHSLLHPKAA